MNPIPPTGEHTADTLATLDAQQLLQLLHTTEQATRDYRERVRDQVIHGLKDAYLNEDSVAELVKLLDLKPYTPRYQRVRNVYLDVNLSTADTPESAAAVQSLRSSETADAIRVAIGEVLTTRTGGVITTANLANLHWHLPEGDRRLDS